MKTYRFVQQSDRKVLLPMQEWPDSQWTIAKIMAIFMLLAAGVCVAGFLIVIISPAGISNPAGYALFFALFTVVSLFWAAFCLSMPRKNCIIYSGDDGYIYYKESLTRSGSCRLSEAFPCLVMTEVAVANISRGIRVTESLCGISALWLVIHLGEKRRWVLLDWSSNEGEIISKATDWSELLSVKSDADLGDLAPKRIYAVIIKA